MKHGRTSAAGLGAVHALTRYGRTFGRPGMPLGSLCGTDYTSEPVNNGSDPLAVQYRGRWHTTEEPVSCRRCLDRLERLAEQALQDEQAIRAISDAAVHKPGGGSHPRPADPDKVRAFRRTWPAMARAVADLLRHRGVSLGEGWLGPARVTEGKRAVTRSSEETMKEGAS